MTAAVLADSFSDDAPQNQCLTCALSMSSCFWHSSPSMLCVQVMTIAAVRQERQARAHAGMQSVVERWHLASGDIEPGLNISLKLKNWIVQVAVASQGDGEAKTLLIWKEEQNGGVSSSCTVMRQLFSTNNKLATYVREQEEWGKSSSCQMHMIVWTSHNWSQMQWH